MPNKCPFCGSENFFPLLTDNPNVHNVLTQVDLSKNPPAFLADKGIPVDAFGCNDCKCITLTNQHL